MNSSPPTASSLKGVVLNIQHFSTHDGPGMRTTVFLKGCPLRCQWCHNPESQRPQREIFFTPEKCIGCGFCAGDCPCGAGRHIENKPPQDILNGRGSPSAGADRSVE